MSEITRGIMEMPYEMAMQSEVSRLQFWNCAREIWQKIQATIPPAAQVHVEQPEVVGVRYQAHGAGWELMDESPFADGRQNWKQGGEELQALMTVAQHERIVAALSANNQRVVPLEPLLAKRHPLESQEAFEAWFAQSGLTKFKDTALAGWQARAALSAPPAAGVPLDDPRGEFRGWFEGWVLENEHPGYGWLGEGSLDQGDTPNSYADQYVHGAWVMAMHLSVEIKRAQFHSHLHLQRAKLAESATPTPPAAGVPEDCVEPYGWVAAGRFFLDRDQAVEAAEKTPCVEVYSRPQMLATSPTPPASEPWRCQHCNSETAQACRDGGCFGVDAEPASEQQQAWPKDQDVGRFGDMSQSAHLRVGLDADNDVYVSVYDEDGGAAVEFCVPGSGGGRSGETRRALIALMVAMAKDNESAPDRDWWANRGGPASTSQGDDPHLAGVNQGVTEAGNGGDV
ncbi:hypothetical protein [Pseudomonas sp. PDM13]|uniref:hypothetical protein n=1 Tax=Pseudomonas sp. PDM13 TaxID=2769255 RepID=UPI0021DF580B|nr:hypothetical protein [Pseudomonas sp. PDM13]MCU9947554.1 hypothetical protein [Pseudomonas sp. PDM13]